ncbi:MAG: glycosyltransferase [Candidatus Hinthialibacter antarcticus]|nr:glycosyltransferase [Candidatus Hinthialibacter antarcticus]
MKLLAKTLLLIGVGPLPFYNSDRLYGFGIRAWQFALPLLRAGHHVVLATCEFGVQRETNINIDYQTDPSSWGDLEHVALPEPNVRNTNLILTRLEDLIARKRPDAIITAGSSIATNLASYLKTDVPVWMDMFGDLFAEVQAKSPFMRDALQIEHFHQTLSRVLLRGDCFSVVSEMQRGAAIGQLGLIGRLNRYTLSEELVWTIPCALNGEISPVRGESILRGGEVNSSDFLVLCSGGFNTWADVDTLFLAIEGAMEKNRRVQCVVTGGAIAGHHEDGYNRFRSLISKSAYESRFHLMGWVSNEDVAQLTLECDLGINIDLPIYESVLGSRNRFLYWMQCGVPILSTLTTEISHLLSREGLIVGIPTGDEKLATAKILEMAANPAKAKARAVKAKRFAYEYFSFESTTQPLLNWVENPVRASDNVEREFRGGQPFHRVDEMWLNWAFPGRDDKSGIIPRFRRPIIKTKPQGKSWWQRLWGV